MDEFYEFDELEEDYLKCFTLILKHFAPALDEGHVYNTLAAAVATGTLHEDNLNELLCDIECEDVPGVKH